ncbi:IclR family transcriptional regulator [Devosia rhodophyticola]|uniref:IclR family transcriptional regulator n=1 Tax=Devosia rhodophyticola TaxID=3026423 RepID=A0ABY7YU75_9HYPH|nr:IclR family transcriptional regulator [Devosia rhodophyticola]WDR04747.1 IclR family transcriptional regulator [Devosia rhodophyticola]
MYKKAIAKKSKSISAKKTGATTGAREGASGVSYSVPALDKALDILELMSELSRPVTPSQIAQQLGRSLQEVYRVVLVLEGRGYIIRPPGTEALVLSTQLYGLATRFPPFRRVVDVAQPIINNLAIESGEAAHIAVLDGLRMCIIAQVDSPQPIGVRLRVGAHSPAVMGSSGRTLVAFQPNLVREWYLQQAATHLERQELDYARNRVDKIIANGCEIVEGRLIPGVIDICFPILDSTGNALAAVTVPYLGTFGVAKPLPVVVSMLHAAADSISMTMGGKLAPLVSPLPQPEAAPRVKK